MDGFKRPIIVFIHAERCAVCAVCVCVLRFHIISNKWIFYLHKRRTCAHLSWLSFSERSLPSVAHSVWTNWITKHVQQPTTHAETHTNERNIIIIIIIIESMRWRSHICVFLLEWHHHSHSHMVSWRRRAVHTYSHACQHEFMLQSMDWFAGLWLRKNIDRMFVPSKMDGCQSLSLSLVQFAVVHEDILDHCTNHYISSPLCVCVCGANV